MEKLVAKKPRLDLSEDCCECQTYTCDCVPTIGFKLNGKGGYGYAVWVQDPETGNESYCGKFLGQEIKATGTWDLREKAQAILDMFNSIMENC